MLQGNKELQKWLQDIARFGLLALQNQDLEIIDSFAAQMTDFQLGGIANKIRGIRKLLSENNDVEFVLSEVCDLYLFSKSFEQHKDLAINQRNELERIAGVTVKKDQVLQQKGEIDYWLVIASEEGIQENLKYKKTWLIGQKSNAIPLILEFVWGNKKFESNWQVGAAIHGEIVYYPGVLNSRALIKDGKWSSVPFQLPDGIKSLKDLQKHYASILERNPWNKTHPIYLTNFTTYFDQKDFFLVDEAKNAIKLSYLSKDKNWKLLALGAYELLNVFGHWDGYTFDPLTILKDNRLIIL